MNLDSDYFKRNSFIVLSWFSCQNVASSCVASITINWRERKKDAAKATWIQQGIVTDWDLNYCMFLEGVKMSPLPAATSCFHCVPGSVVGSTLACFPFRWSARSTKITVKGRPSNSSHPRVSEQPGSPYGYHLCFLKNSVNIEHSVSCVLLKPKRIRLFASFKKVLRLSIRN